LANLAAANDTAGREKASGTDNTQGRILPRRVLTDARR
jgi:hypothetical protein